MEKVRCKVTCGPITTADCSLYNDETKQNEIKKVKSLTFLPVYSGSEENKAFFAATPTLTFSFGTVNEAAAAMFQQGKEYYVDLTPA